MPTNPEVDHIALHHDPHHGWCVYNFHEAYPEDPSDPDWTGEIDLSEEVEFPTYEEANAEAHRRAEHFGVSVNEY